MQSVLYDIAVWPRATMRVRLIIHRVLLSILG